MELRKFSVEPSADKVYVVTLYSEENGGVLDKRIVGVFTDKEKASKALNDEFEYAKEKYGVEDKTRLGNPSVDYVEGGFFYIEDREDWSVDCRIKEIKVNEHLTNTHF